MTSRLAQFALLAGNFVIGLSILAPAGMIGDLAAGLGISIGQAALLVTGGAVVLCLGSPLAAWATSSLDRRLLLAGSMGLLGICHAASAAAPGFSSLFVLRLLAMAFAAVFTPQAASTVAMIVPERDRAGAISFVFLGWSLAVAAGLPLTAWAADSFGWRSVYVALAAAALVSAGAVAATLPRGLAGTPISFASWGALLRDRLVLLLLAATVSASAGQFVIFTYFVPLVTELTGATTRVIAAFFAIFGVAGFLGNVAASRIVATLGPFRTSLLFFVAMAAGAAIWTLGAGALPVMAVGVAVWGLGFAASNSMQQARLALAAPTLSGAAIALNSSAIYVGQALGSAAGGALFGHTLLVAMGYVATALLAATVAIVAFTKPAAKAGSLSRA